MLFLKLNYNFFFHIGIQKNEKFNNEKLIKTCKLRRKNRKYSNTNKFKKIKLNNYNEMLVCGTNYYNQLDERSYKKDFDDDPCITPFLKSHLSISPHLSYKNILVMQSRSPRTENVLP